MTASKVCKDHQARLGCKGKNKFWIAKNQFQVFMQSLAYNLKRLVSLGIKRIELVPS